MNTAILHYKNKHIHLSTHLHTHTNKQKTHFCIHARVNVTACLLLCDDIRAFASTQIWHLSPFHLVYRHPHAETSSQFVIRLSPPSTGLREGPCGVSQWPSCGRAAPHAPPSLPRSPTLDSTLYFSVVMIALGSQAPYNCIENSRPRFPLLFRFGKVFSSSPGKKIIS